MTKKILIVDDGQEDMNTIKEVLEKEDYEVTMATDGAKALELVTGNGFDLILMDVKMTTFSGYDLLRLMREKINHEAKMVFVSIVPEKEVTMEDVDGFIQKPFTPESLLEGVKKALGE